MSTEGVIQYRVVHNTEYSYSSPVSLCHNQLRLAPRELPYQSVERTFVEISPIPTLRRSRIDRFGNQTEFFSIENQHNRMRVVAESIIRRSIPDHTNAHRESFSMVRKRLHNPSQAPDRIAQEFCFESKYIKTHGAFADYAIGCFENQRSLFDCVKDLTSKIHKEFKYTPNSTHVSTTPLDVLRQRQGVCQDFAHLQIACLRSLGLAARYVSGYILTHPAPGQTKLIGTDASHAWISVYLGEFGWFDFDPTNNQSPGNEHITVAWGADYSDVAPVTGLFIGGGLTQMTVGVDMSPMENSPSSPPVHDPLK